jgi:hypothetical protein
MTFERHAILAALLLAATPAAAVPPSSVTNARDPALLAANCAAYLSHDFRYAQGVAHPRSTAALRAWRAELQRLRQSQGDAGVYLQAAMDAAEDDNLDSRMSAAAYCESRAPVRRRRR